MKEIKFRLIKDGKIVGYEKHVLSCGTISIMHTKSLDGIWRYIYPDYKRWIPHDNKDQSTGLKDKNGKEIYEGDIARIEWDNGVITTSVIIWDDWGFCTNLFADLPDAEQMEIIGNIHQNSELLKD